MGLPGAALLSAHLPVLPLALTSVRTFGEALNTYRGAQGIAPRPVAVDPPRVAAAFSSEKYLRIDGKPVDAFAPLSGFFATADGWVRTHANYPHHRARLCELLGLPEDADRADAAARLAHRGAQEVEDAAAACGAVAVRVRTAAEWAASGPGSAARSVPLVSTSTRLDTAVAGAAATPDPLRPLAGVRVLDLTRVIAGPVATRALALAGATVLRIDSPRLPEISWQHADTGQGKLTARLDLEAPDGLRTAQRLAAEADVVVTGYRPGALERLGLFEVPGTGQVRGKVSAWGAIGPWAQRRGFDSIVQAASGIALIEGADRPGALPAQALDHASGYLLAAGIVDALTARQHDQRGRDVTVALARTGWELLDAPGRHADPAPPSLPEVAANRHGAVATAPPALAEYADYPWPAHEWGSDAPLWPQR